MLGGFPNGIFVASAANFISEACTQNLRPMMSSLLALCGLIGVTCGIATGFERIPYVTSGEHAVVRDFQFIVAHHAVPVC